MRRWLLAMPFVACAASGAPAAAAPFCLQATGVPPQCLFYDVAACRRQALRMNAVCGLNPKELMPPATGQRFCQVENGPVIQCLYPDRRSCDAATARRGGICIDAGDAASRPDPDLIPR
ncbi:hypothetical protein [Desertibaculum subflavum]|uniref:hypothetical protein n=1 Tax=Desertibaculum subflavum TaxID=2268458 RepID=UPI000E669032